MQPCGAPRAGTAAPEGATAQAGFSLVELVVVLAVIGLLAVVAAPRFFGNSVFEERAWRDEIVSAFRYARNLAVGSGCPVRVRLNAASYDLSQQAVSAGHCNSADATWPIAVLLPDGQPVSGTAPAGITATPAFTVIFDAAGRTDLVSDQVVTVGGGSFTLRAGSGYVSP